MTNIEMSYPEKEELELEMTITGYIIEKRNILTDKQLQELFPYQTDKQIKNIRSLLINDDFDNYCFEQEIFSYKKYPKEKVEKLLQTFLEIRIEMSGGESIKEWEIIIEKYRYDFGFDLLEMYQKILSK